jgi:inorganic triphosphatase YgiF
VTNPHNESVTDKSMETELKLHVPPTDIERMRQHPVLAEHAVGAPTEHRHTDTYYDTPDHALWKHGLTLRVRERDGACVQTVKTADGPSPGLHRRGEWECELPDATPRPALLARQIKPARVAALLASDDVAARLQPVFRNTTQRTTWDIRLPDGEQVECALDAGDIASGERRAPIAELELELKSGSPAQLFDLALALHHDVPLRMANDSKAARGYALTEPAAPRAVKAQAVRLKKSMTLEDAFQAIGLNCLRQMEANVAGVLARDVESLHQMRVGLRRLRALLDMFEDLAAPPADVADGLEWLAGELGATRDWDVLADTTLDRIDGNDTSALREAARARAARLHKHMLDTLHVPRFTELLLRLNAWLQGRQWRADGIPGAALAANAADGSLPLLRKAERRLARRIGKLDLDDAPARHRVRIAAKKARYAAEFFRDLLPKQAVKRYVSHLSALQDQLGLMNDVAVAERLLPELQHGNGELARQAAYARGYLRAGTGTDVRALKKPLAAVAKLRMRR